MDDVGATRTLNEALAGRYAVEREVGSGGMATVYLAHDVRHERHVALKVLRSELAAVIGAERFLAEIRTTANLQHPGILPLFDSGEAAGQLFYVMPFVEGESLRARLDRERQLPVADAVRIAAEVGDALAYAHDHGVVHRDVKPENVLLQSGRPVIADFGIALAVQQAGGNRLTQTGLSLGTPQYMSPEQAAGERGVDARTDQYSLASMLYEMLAGEPPFSAPSTQALIAKLMTEAPHPLESLRKSVPPHVAAAVHTALEKLPADRFVTTREFVRALTDDSVVSGARRSPSPPPAHANRRYAAIAVGALIAGTALGAAINSAMRRTTEEASVESIRFAIDPDSGQRLALVCCGNMFAISADGRRVVFQATDRDSATRLHVRELDALNARALIGTENPHDIFFSPDGSDVGFVSGRSLRTVELRSGRVRTVAELPASGFSAGGTWTTDRRLVYAVGNVLYAVQVDGGTPSTLVRVDSAKGEYQVGGPHFVAAPGGGSILFSVHGANGEPVVRLLRLSDGTTKELGLGAGPSYVSAHGGWLLATRSDGTLEARRFDAATGDTIGPARRLTDGIALRSPIFLYPEYVASANGTIVTVTRGRDPLATQSVLHLMTGGTDVVHTIPFRARRVHRPRFSPDGRRIVALADDPEKRLTTAFVYDPERRSATPLANSGDMTSADWTADGDSVVSLLASGEVYIQAVAGGAPRRLGVLRAWGSLAQVTVRLPWIVFEGNHGGSNDIGVAHRDSVDHPRVLFGSPLEERWPRLSPDGRHLAFAVLDGGQARVHVVSFPSLGERVVVSPGYGTEPRWSGDGRLFYVDATRRVLVVALRPGSQPGTTTGEAGAAIGTGAVGWDVDATGRRFVYGVDPAAASAPRLVVTTNAVASVLGVAGRPAR